MGADPTDAGDTSPIADDGDDAVMIAFEIKDHAVPGKEVGGSIAVLDVLWREPAGVFDFANPDGQGLPGVGVLAHKILEKVAAEQGHDT
eukprot:gene28280-50110_t